MKTATLVILVYLDKSKSYDYIKDMQSCGAAIQNMLLCANAHGIGSCWVGEILANAKKVSETVGVDGNTYELAAVVTLGYPKSTSVKTPKKTVEDFLLL